MVRPLRIPLPFEEALADALKVKPPQTKQKARKAKRAPRKRPR